MAVNVTNAYVATPPIDGGVFYGFDLGSAAAPTDASTALTSTILAGDHGTIGEDGVTTTIKRDTKDIKMFGGATFINVQDNYDEMHELTFMEDDNDNVIKSVFGVANYTKVPATGSAGTKKTIFHTDQQLPIRSYVITTISGSKKKRLFIERGQITEVAEIKNVHNDVTSYKITLKTYKSSNSAVNYANTVELRDDGKFAVPANYTVTLGTPSAGTFTLTVGGQTTAGIAYNAAAAAVQSALVALSTVGAGNATVSGSAGGPYSVTLALGGVLTGSGAGLTGGSFAVA